MKLRALGGHQVVTPRRYAPEVLEAISRPGRTRVGWDRWTAYEVSWLAPGGVPEVAVGVITLPADSPAIVESKSLKLYLNGLSCCEFASRSDAEACVRDDLERVIGAAVKLAFQPLEEAPRPQPPPPQWRNLVAAVCEQHPGFVATPSRELVPNSQWRVPCPQPLYFDGFRSVCPVTGQPDWATVVIAGSGLELDLAGVLNYLLGFRDHPAFHESCIDELFDAVGEVAQVQKMVVAGFFTRRGGIDISPLRATDPESADFFIDLSRKIRQ